MKVLVADDVSTSRLALRHQLERLGHEVIEAKDGQSAWGLFEKETVPVLITDWMMPKMDGIELCQRIRRAGRAKYTFIIMITSREGMEDYLEGMEAGADDFLTKPHHPLHLAARLQVAERVLRLQEEVSQLEGLLPICSYCKRIRDGQDLWSPLERYIADKTDASLSHSICPDCYRREVVPEMEALTRGPE